MYPQDDFITWVCRVIAQLCYSGNNSVLLTFTFVIFLFLSRIISSITLDFATSLFFTYDILTTLISKQKSCVQQYFCVKSSEEWGWLVRCQITLWSLTLVHHHLFLIIPSYIIPYSYVHVLHYVVLHFTQYRTNRDGNKIWLNENLTNSDWIYG